MFASTERICNHTFLSRLINPDSIVLDLGANRGEFSHGIIERFRCRVVSAEPIRELCEQIRWHPLLEVHAIAIGGKNQNVAMSVISGRCECASVLEAVATKECLTTRSIPMVTLAEFRRLALADRVDLLKVDIEGAEIDLFSACDDDELRGVMQITVEFHDFIYRDLREPVLQIRNRMADIGFWVVPFSLDNSDVLFINRKAGVSTAEIPYLRNIVRYGKGLQRRLSRTARSLGFLAKEH
jgi:FkbM family methyltransferase